MNHNQINYDSINYVYGLSNYGYFDYIEINYGSIICQKIN
jgi:hypothetical protein